MPVCGVVDDISDVQRKAKTVGSMISDFLWSAITPLILTYNEAPNIRRTLEHLGWAKQVVVLDSFSTDETESISRSFPHVVFLQRAFDSFAGQCNYGLTQIHTDWVLSLDADYVLTDALVEELHRLPLNLESVAYYARFKYCIYGRPLRGTLYPPRAVLFRRLHGRYEQIGHGHRLVTTDCARFLKGYVLHDDRKPLARWLASQQGYARLEAEKLLERANLPSSWADRLRRWVWPAAPAAFLYTLFVKRCILDGWPGWYYALQRTYFELLLSLELLDRRLRGSDRPQPAVKCELNGND